MELIGANWIRSAQCDLDPLIGVLSEGVYDLSALIPLSEVKIFPTQCFLVLAVAKVDHLACKVTEVDFFLVQLFKNVAKMSAPGVAALDEDIMDRCSALFVSAPSALLGRPQRFRGLILGVPCLAVRRTYRSVLVMLVCVAAGLANSSGSRREPLCHSVP